MDINAQIAYPEVRAAAIKADTKPVIGPANCHSCHLPGLYWFRLRGWLERQYIGEALGVRQYRFVDHSCTARAQPAQLWITPILQKRNERRRRDGL